VSVEMSPPQPSIARSLRLSPGQPVIAVTVRFDDPATGEPAGLTMVMLKPELFRVSVDSASRRIPSDLPLGRLDGWPSTGMAGVSYRVSPDGRSCV
jgi:hypothetical protein